MTLVSRLGSPLSPTNFERRSDNCRKTPTTLKTMRKVNLDEVKIDERKSPKGKYHKYCQEISVALGRDPDSFDLVKRHPFDLMRARIPPGKSYCPYHAESAQFELYLVVSGKGHIR